MKLWAKKFFLGWPLLLGFVGFVTTSVEVSESPNSLDETQPEEPTTEGEVFATTRDAMRTELVTVDSSSTIGGDPVSVTESLLNETISLDAETVLTGRSGNATRGNSSVVRDERLFDGKGEIFSTDSVNAHKSTLQPSMVTVNLNGSSAFNQSDDTEWDMERISIPSNAIKVKFKESRVNLKRGDIDSNVSSNALMFRFSDPRMRTLFSNQEDSSNGTVHSNSSSTSLKLHGENESPYVTEYSPIVSALGNASSNAANSSTIPENLMSAAGHVKPDLNTDYYNALLVPKIKPRVSANPHSVALASNSSIPGPSSYDRLLENSEEWGRSFLPNMSTIQKLRARRSSTPETNNNYTTAMPVNITSKKILIRESRSQPRSNHSVHGISILNRSLGRFFTPITVTTSKPKATTLKKNQFRKSKAKTTQSKPKVRAAVQKITRTTTTAKPQGNGFRAVRRVRRFRKVHRKRRSTTGTTTLAVFRRRRRTTRLVRKTTTPGAMTSAAGDGSQD